MTEVEKSVVRFLFVGWVDALRNSDTYLQMVKDMPDASKKFDEWYQDPLRIEMTEARLKPLAAFVAQFLEDPSKPVDSPTLQALEDSLKVRPN